MAKISYYLRQDFTFFFFFFTFLYYHYYDCCCCYCCCLSRFNINNLISNFIVQVIVVFFHFVTCQLTCTIWIRISENANWYIRSNVEVHVISAGKLCQYIWGGHTASTKFQGQICIANWVAQEWLHKCTKAMRYNESWTEFRQQRFWNWHTTRITLKVCDFLTNFYSLTSNT